MSFFHIEFRWSDNRSTKYVQEFNVTLLTSCIYAASQDDFIIDTSAWRCEMQALTVCVLCRSFQNLRVRSSKKWSYKAAMLH